MTWTLPAATLPRYTAPPAEEQHLGQLSPPAWPSPDWWADALSRLGGQNLAPSGVDDTTAIQAAINTAATYVTAGTTAGSVVWFAPGTYSISSTLTVPRGVRLIGWAGSTSTRILCTASAVPILRASGTNCHSVRIDGLWLAYSVAQTNSAAVGIAFPSSGGNTGPYYWWSIQGVRITNAFDGIGLESTSAVFFSSNIGTEAPVVIDETNRSAIRLRPSTGSPGLVFGLVYITNTVVTPTAEAVSLGAQQASFAYLSISNWVNAAVVFASLGQYQVQELHIESHIWNAASNLIACNGGQVMLEQINIQGDHNIASNQAIFIVQNAGSRLTVGTLQTALTKSGAGSPCLFNLGANTFVNGPNQWNDINANVTNLPTATTLQGLTNYLGSQACRVAALVDAATVTVEPTSGDYLTLTATAGRTIGAPGHAWSGAQLIFEITNGSGGPMTTTWNGAYHLAGAWTDPANTKVRKIQFTYNGTEWSEDWRSAADITP